MPESLTQEQIKALKNDLGKRHRVLSELIHLELMNSGELVHAELAGRVHDTKDESLVAALRTVDLAVVKLHIEELEDIRNAERRIAAGNYGRCSACDEDIGFARLNAYPTAKRCVSCQRAHEDKVKRQS